MSVYAFEYSLDSLREKIALILGQYGANFVIGTASATAHTVTITKATILAQVEKYIAQSVKMGTASGSATIDLSQIDIVNHVDKLIKDATPKINSTQLSVSSPAFVLTELIDKIDKYIKDNTPIVGTAGATTITFTNTDIISRVELAIRGGLKATDSSSASLAYTHSDLLTQIDLGLFDHAVSPNASLSNLSLTITETTVYGIAKAMSAYKASRMQDGKAFDDFTLTDDEVTIMKIYLDEGIQELSKYMAPINGGFSLNTGVWTCVINSLPSVYSAILTQYFNTYLANYIVYKWTANNGNIEAAKMHDEKCQFYIKELDTILTRKSESYEAYLKEAFGIIETILNPVMSSAYAYVANTSHTLAISASHGLSASGVSALTATIKKLAVAFSVNKWKLKLGLQSADVDFSELDQFTQEKYNSILAYITEANGEVNKKLERIVDSNISYNATSPGTYTVSITTANKDITSKTNANIKEDILEFVSRYVTNRWMVKNETKPLFENLSIESLDRYINQKYTSLVEYITRCGTIIESKLDRIMSGVVNNSSSITFPLSNTYNLTTVSQQALSGAIEKLLINYAANQWLIKLSGKELTPIDFSELDLFNNEKLESINKSVELNLQQLCSYLESMSAAYSFSSPNHTITLSPGYNLATASITTLSGLIENYVIFNATLDWTSKVGLSVNLSDKIQATLSEIVRYTPNKYDTLTTALSIRANDILTAIKFATSTTFTDGATTLTYSLLNNGNFDNQSVQNISNAINNYLANSIAYDWLVKSGNNTASVYLSEMNKQYELLKSLTERKRDVIDAILKKAAYKVYSRFQFAGKEMEKPVLYNEEYTWTEDQTLNDGGDDDFTLSATTVDAENKIYYRLLNHVNWPESEETRLIELIEEALVNYSVKEYVIDKPNTAFLYPIYENKYEDNISDIRINLFTRKKGYATRRNSEWL